MRMLSLFPTRQSSFIVAHVVQWHKRESGGGRRRFGSTATPFVSSSTTHAGANKSLFCFFFLLSLDRIMPRYRDNPEFTLV
jgi:hypothetical protein